MAAGDAALLRELNTQQLLSKDKYGNTPAHWAAHNNHTPALRCLHELAPTSLKARDRSGSTPAHAAAYNDSEATLRCLWELVPWTLEAVSQNGQTPAHYAASANMQGVACKSRLHNLRVLRCLHELVPASLRATVGYLHTSLAHTPCLSLSLTAFK